MIKAVLVGTSRRHSVALFPKLVLIPAFNSGSNFGSFRLLVQYVTKFSNMQVHFKTEESNSHHSIIFKDMAYGPRFNDLNTNHCLMFAPEEPVF